MMLGTMQIVFIPMVRESKSMELAWKITTRSKWSIRSN